MAPAGRVISEALASLAMKILLPMAINIFKAFFLFLAAPEGSAASSHNVLWNGLAGAR